MPHGLVPPGDGALKHDTNPDLCGKLSALYNYAYRKLIEANVDHNLEALDEALKLETALARLRTEHRIAVLHYAPIRATVEGEPEEIFPFLGSSRLEEPLSRYPVHAVFHGHAHRGSPEGRTLGGIPVYNVSLPVLRQAFPDRPPFHLLELPA